MTIHATMLGGPHDGRTFSVADAHDSTVLPVDPEPEAYTGGPVSPIGPAIVELRPERSDDGDWILRWREPK